METNSKAKIYLGYGYLAAKAILALWLIYWIVIVFLEDASGTRGEFGDMFGAINALFTGLAFAALIITIIMQSNELKIQQKELKLQRKEFKQQNKTLTLQRFENTFFNLISLHHQIVGAIDYSYYRKRKMYTMGWVQKVKAESEVREMEKVTIIGRDVFRHLYTGKNKLKDQLKSVLSTDGVLPVYLPHFRKIENDFKHYFRNLYRIIKLVDETDFSFGNSEITTGEVHKIRYKYTSIVRAQLSPYELIWLFYNTLARVHSKYPDRNFYNVIVRYTLFRGFPFRELASPSHKNWYESGAYNLPNETHSTDPFDIEIGEQKKGSV